MLQCVFHGLVRECAAPLARLLDQPVDELGDQARSHVIDAQVGSEELQRVALQQAAIFVARFLPIAPSAGALIALNPLQRVDMEERVDLLARNKLALAVGASIARLVSVQPGSMPPRQLRLTLPGRLTLAGFHETEKPPRLRPPPHGRLPRAGFHETEKRARLPAIDDHVGAGTTTDSITVLRVPPIDAPRFRLDELGRHHAAPDLSRAPRK